MKKKKKKVYRLKRVYKNIGLCIFIVIAAWISFTFLAVIYRPKFKDVTIELGTQDIDLNAFVVSKMYKKRSICQTDLETVDLSTVGDKELVFTFADKEEKVILHVVDTTAPQVTYKDITKSSDYKIEPKDFVESVDN